MPGKGDAMLVIESRETRLGGKTLIVDFFGTRGRTSPALTWSGFVDWARGERRRIRPVVLTVDEIRNLPEDEDGPAAQLLRKLHSGRDDLPILGGLAWSEEHLDGLALC